MGHLLSKAFIQSTMGVFQDTVDAGELALIALQRALDRLDSLTHRTHLVVRRDLMREVLMPRV